MPCLLFSHSFCTVGSAFVYGGLSTDLIYDCFQDFTSLVFGLFFIQYIGLLVRHLKINRRSFTSFQLRRFLIKCPIYRLYTGRKLVAEAGVEPAISHVMSVE